MNTYFETDASLQKFKEILDTPIEEKPTNAKAIDVIDKIEKLKRFR